MVLFKSGVIACVFDRIQVFGGLMIADCRNDVLVLVPSPSCCLRAGSGDHASKM